MDKTIFYTFCKAYVTERIQRIQGRIQDLQNALDSETKSSAGDKHETGRAMVQLEREKLGTQLALAERMQVSLGRVSLQPTLDVIGPGSWVRTSGNNYYLCISAGECSHKGETTYCISMATPIAKSLMGKTVGDTMEFKGASHTIIAIT